MTQLCYGEWIRASGAKEVECVSVLKRNNERLQSSRGPGGWQGAGSALVEALALLFSGLLSLLPS